ncbi:LLM class flavin-dependent oxidoreductase [Gordonia lacunae]|uniref:Alkanesulfonate monooxygenase n=1 Tax=Gordonia lacunae TaxID=417102 RepID=A0A243QF15_9ACTN|nr:LLM class flavin-dependent oxidoreductase [Gordonia lacunae]OUC80322.1 alkanesulfonate monooxygenase [Gordonia lacunae]
MVAFEWEVPTRGDSRHVGSAARHRGGWAPTPGSAVATDLRTGGRWDPFDPTEQVITAIDTAGYDTVIAPYDPAGEESWILAGIALRRTRHARVAVEFHPGFGTPVYAAKVSATLQRNSDDRLQWQLRVVTDAADNRARGDRLTDAERYRRADEFLTVAKGVWDGAGARQGGFDGGEFNHVGEFYEVTDGGLDRSVHGHRFPTVRLTGESDEALALSARHGDIHLFELSSTGAAPLIGPLSERAAALGRTVAAGLYLPVIARATKDEAVQRLRRQWRDAYGADADTRAEDLWVDDLTFAGFDRIGHRHPIGLVGSYDEVAQRIVDLTGQGFERFVLSGIPNIEELNRNTEHLLFRADERNRVLA